MVEWSKQELKRLSREIGEADAMRATMFPSLLPQDRKHVSPLGGIAKPSPELKPTKPKSKLVW
jgi:hypothetical protein